MIITSDFLKFRKSKFQSTKFSILQVFVSYVYDMIIAIFDINFDFLSTFMLHFYKLALNGLHLSKSNIPFDFQLTVFSKCQNGILHFWAANWSSFGKRCQRYPLVFVLTDMFDSWTILVFIRQTRQEFCARPFGHYVIISLIVHPFRIVL
jgi:hypothetical protein